MTSFIFYNGSDQKTMSSFAKGQKKPDSVMLTKST